MWRWLIRFLCILFCFVLLLSTVDLALSFIAPNAQESLRQILSSHIVGLRCLDAVNYLCMTSLFLSFLPLMPVAQRNMYRASRLRPVLSASHQRGGSRAWYLAPLLACFLFGCASLSIPSSYWSSDHYIPAHGSFYLSQLFRHRKTLTHEEVDVRRHGLAALHKAQADKERLYEQFLAPLVRRDA